MIHPDVVGCDVSKHFLDLFDARSQRGERIANTASSIEAWLARTDAVALIVFEATGVYDRALRMTLDAHGLAYARVNPSRARDFARAAGFLAKTDAVDARMLARLGQTLEPRCESGFDAARETLAAYVKRRDQLVKMRAQERVRLRCADPVLADDIKAHLGWLDQRIKQADAAIAARLKADAALKQRVSQLKTAPGIGPVAAAVIAALMPELGARDPKAIAALAGLAPLNADSGLVRGQRRIRGGRRRVREALYMAALSAIRCKGRFASFYRRLRDAGKTAKQAIIAVARKLLIALNAMVRDNAAFAA
jgi:transposase